MSTPPVLMYLDALPVSPTSTNVEVLFVAVHAVGISTVTPITLEPDVTPAKFTVVV